eukprot:477276-Hanusia_phi.AAC.7
MDVEEFKEEQEGGEVNGSDESQQWKTWSNEQGARGTGHGARRGIRKLVSKRSRRETKITEYLCNCCNCSSRKSDGIKKNLKDEEVAVGIRYGESRRAMRRNNGGGEFGGGRVRSKRGGEAQSCVGEGERLRRESSAVT